MTRVYGLLPGLLVALALLFSPRASAQTTFLGGGPTYTLPQGSFAESNGNAWGGLLTYESRKYCQLWFGLRLHYTHNVPLDTAAPEFTGGPYYTDAVSLAPTARFFFTKPLEFPLYLQGMLHFSSISTSDSLSTASPVGLGVGIGAGYLIMYDSDCCNWFFDIYAHYQVPNLILRSSERPALPALVVGLNFNYSL